MFKLKRSYLIFGILLSILIPKNSYSENLYEVLESIQKDLRTLEKAVYSDNFSANEEITVSTNTLDQNSEEVLTRHLLKLSEIEKQFQELTNKFEEINFKLDKLSTRMSKIQADNQMRFQQLEDQASTINLNQNQDLIDKVLREVPTIGLGTWFLYRPSSEKSFFGPTSSWAFLSR